MSRWNKNGYSLTLISYLEHQPKVVASQADLYFTCFSTHSYDFHGIDRVLGGISIY